MADDNRLPEGESAPAPETVSQGTPPAPPDPGSGGRRWGVALLGVALLAVILTMVGVFGQMHKEPNHLPLGLGLLLWGVLDLVAQGRGLVRWKGAQAAVGNVVNLVRGLALLGLGLWLALMAAGVIRPQGTAVVTTLGLSLLVAYLGVALALDILVKGARLSGQAFLLAALAFMFISYLYFSIPFTYSWAAVFALLAFVTGAWASHNGALDDSPALGWAVLITVLLIGAPLITYSYQQMFVVEEQPLFTPTLLIPRMRVLVTGLGQDAGQIRWAPVHTHTSQPGDILYTDKLAFTDWRDDKPGVGLFQQQADGRGQLSWVKTGEQVKLTGFSIDGSRLAFTQVLKGAKVPVLSILEPAPDAGFAPLVPSPQARTVTAKSAAQSKALAPRSLYRLRNVYLRSVEPGPAHNQVWRQLGRQLYFAAPGGSLRQVNPTIMRADLKSRVVSALRPGRGLPAVSPDGRSLLSVGFERDVRYLEMADGTEGTTHPRLFVPAQETRYFPAWNADQTRVLHIMHGRLVIMHSNGTHQHAFDPAHLGYKLWYSKDREAFTLQWKNSGDLFKIYRSLPDGSHEKLIYTAAGREVSAPAWSADGRRIALSVRGDDGSHILTVGSDGSWPRSFFATTDPLRELQWSPDGLKLAWLVDRLAQDTQEAWTAKVAGLDPLRIYATPGRLCSLSWGPGGDHLAMQETSAWTFLGLRLVKPDIDNVVVVDLTDHHARVMTRYGVMARQPAFSPHGVAMGYLADQNPWAPGFLRDRTADLVISQLY